MVIADSVVWIAYLRSPGSDVGREMVSLMRQRQLVMVGVVLAEVLQGSRSPSEFTALLSQMEELPYVEESKGTWIKAGELSARLRGQGRPVPMTDLAIAAVAMEHGHQIYTLDQHFQRIPGVELYQTGAS